MAPSTAVSMEDEYAGAPRKRHEREHTFAVVSPPIEESYERSPDSGRHRQYVDDYQSRREELGHRSLRHRAESRTSLRQSPSSPVSSIGSASPTAQRAPSPPRSSAHSRSVSRGAQSYVRTQSPGPIRDRDAGPVPARSKLASLVHDFASPPTGPAPVARA